MTRTGKFLVTVGLSLALTLAAVSPAAAVSTLTGESLSGSSSSGNTFCPDDTTSTFSVSGPATGPYPGTFSESGTINSGFVGETFIGNFTITSGTTTITGRKTRSDSPGDVGCFVFSDDDAPYTATIHTPSGNFHDEGTSSVLVFVGMSPLAPPTATLTESFTSSLAAPVLIEPNSKDQCKNNGWRNFPQFKNQGQCVSFVESRRHT